MIMYVLENEMASHSNILDWKIPQTEEPGGLQSMGSQRVTHDWATEHVHVRSLSRAWIFVPSEVGSFPLGWPRKLSLMYTTRVIIIFDLKYKKWIILH